MSNEELNDEMAEDEASDLEEPEDIAEEPEDEDYSYSAAETSGGGGSSAGIWVIIALVIVALIGLGYYQLNRAATERAEREAAERHEIRSTQLTAAVRGLPEAEEALNRGDIDLMIASLRQMDEMLQIIASAANQAGDTEDAQRITEMRQTVRNAINDLEPAYLELQRQREQLQQAASARLAEISQRFGTFERAPSVDPAEPEPIDEPVVDEPIEDPAVEDTPRPAQGPPVQDPALEGDDQVAPEE